jgi:hypothetical protein
MPFLRSFIDLGGTHVFFAINYETKTILCFIFADYQAENFVQCIKGIYQ